MRLETREEDAVDEGDFFVIDIIQSGNGRIFGMGRGVQAKEEGLAGEECALEGFVVGWIEGFFVEQVQERVVWVEEIGE